MNVGTTSGVQSLMPNRPEKSVDTGSTPSSASKPVSSERSNGDFSKVLKSKSDTSKKLDSKNKKFDDDNDIVPQSPDYQNRPIAAKIPKKGGNGDAEPVRANAIGDNKGSSTSKKQVGQLETGNVEGAWAKNPALESSALSEVGFVEETAGNELNPEAQEAIMKFLATMKAELGVEPQEIMEAMGQLEVDDLLKTPEETMSQVLDGLNLQGTDRLRATDLYQTMLKETAQASLEDVASKIGKVDVKVMSPDELKQERLLTSLEKLNREFFPRKDLNAQQNQTPLAARMNGPVLPNVDQSKSQQRDDKFEMPAFFGAAAAGGALAGQTVGQQRGSQALTAPSSDPYGINQLPAMKADAIDAAPVKTQPKGAESKFTIEGLAGAIAAANGEAPRDSAESESFEGDLSQTPGQPLQTHAPQQSKDMFAPTLAGTQLQQPVRQGDEAANVRHLIQGAQLLIQNGGGEMKIQMQPEGMGNVDLKVSIKEGKVDIRMMAENHDTKRLLESGLADLKDNLIGQKLNVDTLKVDVSPKNSDLEQQLANQQRETAREFLGQFRQQNFANRQQFLDTTGMKSYGQRRSKTLTPADVPTAASRVRDNSRRLDLVA